jgi:hypothetical protein
MPRSCAAARAAAICPAIRERLEHRQRPGREPLRQVRAVDELHHQRDAVTTLDNTVDLRDVGMVQRRERLRLALEAGQALRVEGEAIRQDLDRDITIEPGIAGAVDLAHATLPDE